MMDYCTYCPKMCTFSCPVSEATDNTTFTPWGKMQIARWLIDKTVPMTSVMAAAAYQCTDCLHCQQYCEHHNDVPGALHEIRKMAVQNYAAPPQVYSLEGKFAASNNPYGRDLLKNLREKLPGEFLRKDSRVLFFPCCHTLQLFPERILTYFNLFKKLGIEGISLFDEEIQCCGAPLRALGFEEEFQEIAEVQFYSLKNYKLIVTDGNECCHSLKNNYAPLHLSLQNQTVHLLEFLAPYLKHSNYRSQAKMKGRLAYYDPPFLSRYLGIIDLPRKFITELTGFPPLELSMNGKDTLSAGVEGCYDVVFPLLADEIAARTVEEMTTRGIGKLVTADAKAEAIFRRLAKNFKVQDLYEFLEEHIIK